MAAPAAKTIRDLNGKWKLNKQLSGSADAALSLQGISWLVRKAVQTASVTIDVKQYEAVGAPAEGVEVSAAPVMHIDFLQIASGLEGNTEERSLDWLPRKSSDWIWGKVVSQTKYVNSTDLKELANKYGAWIAEGWAEDTEYVWAYIESEGNGWVAAQAWGFQEISGERHFCRKIYVEKDGKSENLLNVYDYTVKK